MITCAELAQCVAVSNLDNFSMQNIEVDGEIWAILAHEANYDGNG